MCELLAISSRAATGLSFSIEALAARSGPGHSARDGWGVAIYQGPDVALYRETSPASDSPLLHLLEKESPPTRLAISHIRKATLGAITLANTQPSVREMAGHSHVFAHNGHLPGIQDDPRFALAGFHPLGETDSEYAFCALLARLAPLWKDMADGRTPTLQARLEIVAGFAADLRPMGPANFLYADGELLFAHGHRRTQASKEIEPPGLHLLQRSCTQPQQGLPVQGVTVGCDYGQAVLLASVPLGDGPWEPLAEGETVVVAGGDILARHRPTQMTGKR